MWFEEVASQSPSESASPSVGGGGGGVHTSCYTATEHLSCGSRLRSWYWLVLDLLGMYGAGGSEAHIALEDKDLVCTAGVAKFDPMTLCTPFYYESVHTSPLHGATITSYILCALYTGGM